MSHAGKSPRAAELPVATVKYGAGVAHGQHDTLISGSSNDRTCVQATTALTGDMTPYGCANQKARYPSAALPPQGPMSLLSAGEDGYVWRDCFHWFRSRRYQPS